MSIVKIEHEQQNEVINGAVHILRSRMRGKIKVIESIHQEFLAYSPENTGKKDQEAPKNGSKTEVEDFITKGFPQSLEVLSVSRAIEEAVRDIITKQRPHIENPSVSEPMLVSLGDKVLRIFNSSQKERIALAGRFAQFVNQRMKKNYHEAESKKYKMIQELKWYFEATDPGAKGQLFANICSLLADIHGLNEENEKDDAMYDISSLSEGSDQEEEEEDLEKKFRPGNIFDTGGGLDMSDPVRDEEFRQEMEEDIKLSEPESELQEYLPTEIKNDKRIIGEIYYWQAYAEEWQKELLDIKKDAPEDYLDMLESIHMRKLVIYSIAEQRMREEEAKRGKGPVNKKLLDHIQDYLPDLEQEINILWDKIERIKKKKEQAKKTKNGPHETQSILEKSFGDLKRKYRGALKTFLEMENYDEVTTIENSLLRAYNDLESHCLKNNLKSEIVGTPEEPGITAENTDGMMTIEQYLDNPDYFRSFPSELSAPKSESERILEKVCGIVHNHPALRYNSGTIQFVYIESDGSESSDVEKMILIKSIVQDTIERKMVLYFHAKKWLEDNENGEVENCKYILENEILTMKRNLKMISRRIKWDENTAQKGPELQTEIDYLSQCRNDLLRTFIRDADTTVRHGLEGKILTLTDAMISRRKELTQTPTKTEKPHSHIQAEPLSPNEGSLVRYVPIPLRKNESTLFGREIPYFAKKLQSNPDHTWEKNKGQANHHLERKMLIYLFGMKRIREIDNELAGNECKDKEKLILEREFLEEDSHNLHGEILPLIERISELKTYSLEQAKFESEEDKTQALIHKATAVHAQLDGKLAHSNTDLAKKVEYYWHTLQRYVLRFRSRVLIATEKGNLASIKQIQAEFDTEMHFIILDMQKTLEELQASKRTTEKMVNTVATIRRELFGNKDA